ncbi:MAG: hypothetical protein FGM37_09515 [Phycisphaerales bacterium]|nr:hypothetical protein [Phycisphaerales bacterium]
MIEAGVLERLAQPAGACLADAVSRALADHPLTPADVARWRRDADPALVSAAIELASARASLHGRIAAADAFWCDRAGAAQASDDLSAQWKAQRAATAAAALQTQDARPTMAPHAPGLHATLDAPHDADSTTGRPSPILVDYCCGIGADLAHFGLALDGLVEGMDLRADRAWMARRNAGATVHVSDVRSWRSNAPLAHIDPSRRDEGTGARRHGWDALEPGPEVIADLIAHHAGVMVKLGPGTDVPPDARPPGSELAVISRARSLTQAVLCTGTLAAPTPARRHACDSARAVLLREGVPTVEIAGQPSWSSGRGAMHWPCVGGWNRIIAEPDPSLERSGLLPDAARALSLAEVHPGLGLCTDAGPQCNLTAVDASPWWRTWDALATVPARLDDVRVALLTHHAGIVDVKVRGGAADADEWSRLLRGDGALAATVFVHRVPGRGIEAVIAMPRNTR